MKFQLFEATEIMPFRPEDKAIAYSAMAGALAGFIYAFVFYYILIYKSPSSSNVEKKLKEKQKQILKMQKESESVKAAIFDLDGTLLDTESLSTRAIQKILDEYDKEFTWELKRMTLGLPSRGSSSWTALVIKELELEGKLEVEDFAKQCEINLNELCSQIKEMPGAFECVRWCKYNGMKIGIATSSNRKAVEHKRKN